jgi:16S rRNA (guanine(966)-N(2))-methyltransferase RsmD
VRIISGIYRGKTLHPPKNLPTRPTTDFAKTGLFNMLNNRINYEDILVLDLCCGTGNITFEFASRGAKHITSVDNHAACLKYISDMARELKFANIKTWKVDIFRFMDKTDQQFDVIFADPPYEVPWIEQISQQVFEKKLLRNGGLLVIEHGAKTNLSAQPHFEEARNYGNVNFSIFTYNEQ